MNNWVTKMIVIFKLLAYPRNWPPQLYWWIFAYIVLDVLFSYRCWTACVCDRLPWFPLLSERIVRLFAANC